MSSTNKTANYNLPQFIGTDKPTWLGDVNQAMSIIDGQMKTNADNITSASGEVSELETRVQTAESNVSSLSTAVQTVQNQANTTDGNLNTLSSTVASLIEKLALGTAVDANASTIISAITSAATAGGTLYLSQSDDGSLFKFYGTCYTTRTNSSSTTANKISISGLTGYYGIDTGLVLQSAPSEAYIVNSAGTLFRCNTGNTSVNGAYALAFAVGTNGHIYIEPSTTQAFNIPGAAQDRRIYYPCLYFNSNFGDIESE